MTDKEMAFIREYSKDWNKRQAAIRAGYSEDNASDMGFDLANKPEIARRVRQLQTERGRRLEMSATWTVDQFFQLYQKCMDEGDHRAAAKALENIGKIVGVFLKDNEQKHGIKNEAERDAIMERLKARGLNFEVVNAPSTN